VFTRQRLRALGCMAALTLAGTAAATATSTAPAGASPTRIVRRLAYVGTIPKSVQQEIATVHKAADLAHVSAAARRVIQQPAIEVIESGKATDSPTTLAVGRGKLGKGCWQAWVSRKRENTLGWVLMSVKTAVRNVCSNGTRFTATPRTERTIRSRWGWTLCDVDDAFGGYRSRTHYAATANVNFGLAGSCATAPKVVHSEMQVYANGRYSWST
jgi:hypothetical protein